MIEVLNGIIVAKSNTEQAARQIANETGRATLNQLMKTVSKSSRIIAEDLSREVGFMLPQSENAKNVLGELAANPPSEDFPTEEVKELLAVIKFQNK